MSLLTYPLNGITYDAEDAETYLCTRTSGVFASDGHYQASVTDSREVTISSGLAWIRNTEFHGKAVYNPDPVAITVPIADGSVGRIDRIVLRFDKSANESTIELVQGTPASSPVPPAVTQTEEIYELGLCTVNVSASAVSLTAADVTSTLLDESVCGIMRDGVTQIPTEQLQEQVYELLEELGEALTGVQTGSGIMTTTVYDKDGGAKQVAFKDEFDEAVETLTNSLTNGAVTKVGTLTVGGTARGIYMNAGTPTALSATVGGSATPVYMSSGTITACSSTIGSGTKPIYMSGGTLTASSSTVGSGTQPVYLNGGTLTACGTTVGGAARPIYSNGGVLTACSSTVGSETKPVYMSSGTITASSSTVGSSTQPVYMNGGTITACSSAFTPKPSSASNVNILTAGFLTTSRTSVYFSIPFWGGSATISNISLRIRQSGSYLVGSAKATASFTGTANLFQMPTWINVCLEFSSSIGGTDNAPVGIDMYFDLTVS